MTRQDELLNLWYEKHPDIYQAYQAQFKDDESILRALENHDTMMMAEIRYEQKLREESRKKQEGEDLKQYMTAFREKYPDIYKTLATRIQKIDQDQYLDAYLNKLWNTSEQIYKIAFESADGFENAIPQIVQSMRPDLHENLHAHATKIVENYSERDMDMIEILSKEMPDIGIKIIRTFD